MLYLVVSTENDSELSTQHTTITAVFSETLLMTPDNLSILPDMESKQQSNTVSSSVDYSVFFQNSEISKTIGQNTTLLEIISAKVQSMLILGSPTMSTNIESSILNLHLSQICETGHILSIEGERKLLLEKLGFVNIAQLSGLNWNIRTNNGVGVYPSDNVLFIDQIVLNFKKLQLLGCKDSLFTMMDIISKFNTNQTPVIETPILPVSITEDSDSLDTFEMVEDFAFGGPTRKSIDEELDWQMDFDSTISKEEFLNDKVKSNLKAIDFKPNFSFLDSLEPILRFEDRETPQLCYVINGEEVSWLLYEGYDFDPLDQAVNERGSHQAEIVLQKLEINVKLYPAKSVLSKLFELKIRDLEIVDNVSTSNWSKFLTYQIPGPDDPPRITNSPILKLNWKGIRTNTNEEFVLELGILPLQLYIDQDTLTSLELYFTRDGPVKLDSSPIAPIKESIIFFQKIEMDPIIIQIDYKPKRVDINRISNGELVELINFLNIDGASVYLKPIKLVGVHGWKRFFKQVGNIWLPHVKSTQIPQMASGVPGIKSIMTLGGGISDLILLPIEQYKKDGRIIRGITRGANSFLKAASVESTRIVSKLAAGAQTLIENVEQGISNKPTVSKFAEQPKDFMEGVQIGFRAINTSVQDAAKTLKPTGDDNQTQAQAVPLAMLQPVKGVATAIAQILVGIHNTLDGTQQLRMRNKYKLQ